MMIERWHNLTSLAELTKAVKQLNEWAAANKVDPDTIYISHGRALHLELTETELTDKSKVYDLRVHF